MKSIPALLLADLRADSTAMAFLWTIQMKDGRMIRGTDHDMDIVIPASGSSPVDPYAGTYHAIAAVTMGDVVSTTDLSVDNLQVEGAFPPIPPGTPPLYTILDVTVDEIESGLLDQAPVTVLCCNWQAPAHGYFIVKSGVLGTINHDSDGKYVTEVRGLTQLLAQTIIRTFSSSCNVVKFGDVRCKFNVAAVTTTGTVTADASLSRQEFSVSLASHSPPTAYSYGGGTLTFTSGVNSGFFREVKVDPNTNAGVIQFWNEFPESIAVGDTFTLAPGCDRTNQMCKNVYNNLVNNRAFGCFIPGVNALTQGPTTVSGIG